MTPGLASLLAPTCVEDFFAAYEEGRPFVAHELDVHRSELGTLQLLASLDELLLCWPRIIEAHLPDLRDEASSITVNGVDARKVFDNGMGLLFSEANLVSPTLATWLEALRADLGLSAQSYGRCLIYATPSGKGTAAHFDQNDNFVLQIHGTKNWELAPNEHVIHPLTRHTIGQLEDPELASYLAGPMPVEMPEPRMHVELRPGSLLYVPRGTWHQTTSDGDSLALNFTFTPASWADLFLGALRSRLLLSPAWRESAGGFAGPHATRHLDALLAELVDDLPNWRAADILMATEPDFQA